MAWDDPTAQQQASARSRAIAAGHSPEEVDAFIANQGGARTSESRILTAFGVQAGSNPGQSGPNPATSGGGGSTGGGGSATPPASVDAMNKVAIPGIENAANSLSLAAGAGSVGGGGEATNATASMSGMLRALGQRRPPTQSLVLNRKAY